MAQWRRATVSLVGELQSEARSWPSRQLLAEQRTGAWGRSPSSATASWAWPCRYVFENFPRSDIGRGRRFTVRWSAGEPAPRSP